MNILYGVVSDIGNVRDNNEDNFRVQEFYRTEFSDKQIVYSGESKEDCFVAAVFDGMGGEEAGEVASLIAAKNLQTVDITDVHITAENNINTINDLICDYIKLHGDRTGATIATLYIKDSEAISCNIGDSVVYLYREGALQRISKIHNRAQMLIDMGVITAEEARNNNGKYELTQYLGIDKEEMILTPAFSENIDVQSGDRFLICSDGLLDAFSEEELSKKLGKTRDKSAVELACILVTEALSTECKDNTTVIVVDTE